MIFLFNKIRLVQIRDGMAMGIKRASEWACWRNLFLVNQSINRESVSLRSTCQKFVLKFAPKRFYCIAKCLHLEFHSFFLDSKQKTGIQISQTSKVNKSLLNHFGEKTWKKFFCSGRNSSLKYHIWMPEIWQPWPATRTHQSMCIPVGFSRRFEPSTLTGWNFQSRDIFFSKSKSYN